MRKLLLSIGLLILIFAQGKSQSLGSLKRDVFKSFMPKHGIPEQIIRTQSFYSTSEVKKQKNIIDFSARLDTIMEKRFEDELIKAQAMYLFDDNKRLVYISFKEKVSSFGWQEKHTYYKYDNNGLSEIRRTNVLDQLIDQTRTKSDSLHNPIYLIWYNADLNLKGYETGEYLYAQNKCIRRMYNNQAELQSKEECSIESKESDESKFNQYGDCTFYPRAWFENDKVYFQVDYKYDELGNWIEKKLYRLIIVENKVTDKTVLQKIKRKIKYRAATSKL